MKRKTVRRIKRTRVVHRKRGRPRHHAKAFTSSTVHPTLVRRKRGHYGRSERSKSMFPSVVLQNPYRRMRKHYRVKRNPPIMTTVIDTGKTLLAFLASIGISNVVTNAVNKTMPMSLLGRSAVQNASRIGVVFLASKYAKKYIGSKTVEDLKVIVMTYAAYDLLMTFISQQPSLSQYFAPFELESGSNFQSGGQTVLGRLVDDNGNPVMGMVTDDKGSSIAGIEDERQMNSMESFAQGS